MGYFGTGGSGGSVFVFRSGRSGQGRILHQKGFTLLEVLVALFILSACLAPLSLYFYKSGFNQAAYEKYQAGQLLKREMHRSFLTGKKTKAVVEISEPKYFRVEIIPETSPGETCWQGRVFNRSKVRLAELKVCRYE